MHPNPSIYQVPQDLHIHTIFSKYDSAVVPEQRLELIAALGHAERIGISDHFESLEKDDYPVYVDSVRSYGFLVGTEVDGWRSADHAASLEFDYYLYHCYDTDRDYRGVEKLLATGKPVIISHPHAMDTDLNRVPPEAMVEINNRYIWKCDWRSYYTPFVDRFQYVISSDAHQPGWLGQNMARYVARELGIQETIFKNAAQLSTRSVPAE